MTTIFPNDIVLDIMISNQLRWGYKPDEVVDEIVRWLGNYGDPVTLRQKRHIQRLVREAVKPPIRPGPQKAFTRAQVLAMQEALTTRNGGRKPTQARLAKALECSVTTVRRRLRDE